MRVVRKSLLRIVDLFYRIVPMSRSRQPTLSGGLELAALLAVARLERDAYGLEVRRELIERSGRDYAVGAIYTTLKRLEDKGFLTSHLSEPLPVRGGRSRRHFALTGAGQRALLEAERNAATMWSGVGTILRPRTS
jgi:PadR family transcriptional regulator PadR